MSLTNALDSLGGGSTQAPATSSNRAELGQEEYLKLMITQFQNQDPFKPMENGDFLGQLAQFGTVSGIEELKESFSAVASSISSDQTLQASGLIGRTVLAQTNTGSLIQGGDMAGAVDLPQSSSGVTVDVRDAAGQLVRRLDIGPQGSGLARFQWDGITADGSFAPSGPYTFTARFQTPEGPQAANALVAAEVESVSLSPETGSLSLNFRDMASLGLHQIRQIM